MLVKKKRFLIPMHLQHFAEGTEGENTQTGEAGQASGETKNTETKTDKQDHMIPKTRLDELSQKYKNAQAQLDQLLAEKAEQERKAKEQQGEFQSLYENANKELDSFKSKAEQLEGRSKQLEGVINQMLELRLSNIPEEAHELIPEGMTPEQKLAWIEKAEQKGFFGNKASEQPVGQSTNPTSTQTTDLTALNPFQLLQAGYGRK